MVAQSASAAEASINLPSLRDKVVLVTGANSGLGRQAVLDIAKHSPSCIWLAARNLEKASQTAKEIQSLVPGAKIKPLALDLSSLASVKTAAHTVLQDSQRLDVLMLNAGIMAQEPALSEDGYEIQMAVNHLAHAYLTNLLLPLLKSTCSLPGADVRVVSLSSDAHRGVTKKTGFQLDAATTKAEELGSMGRYAHSKLAGILWIRQFAKIHPDITASAVHPGLVTTNLLQNASALPGFLKIISSLLLSKVFADTEKGVKNQLWAATSKQVNSGEYYQPVGVSGKGTSFAVDDKLAKKVYDWTQEQLEGR